jgi:hypothetical protein
MAPFGMLAGVTATILPAILLIVSLRQPFRSEGIHIDAPAGQPNLDCFDRMRSGQRLYLHSVPCVTALFQRFGHRWGLMACPVGNARWSCPSRKAPAGYGERCGSSRVSGPERSRMGKWLSAHHADSLGGWLVLGKKGTVDPTTISYDEALDEAICFGWIDGQLGRRDSGLRSDDASRFEELAAPGLNGTLPSLKR